MTFAALSDGARYLRQGSMDYRERRKLNVVVRLGVIFLCLSILSTVTGCSVNSARYGTSSSAVGAYQGEPSGSGTDYARRLNAEERQYGRPWGDQGAAYHPWERPRGYGDLNE